MPSKVVLALTPRPRDTSSAKVSSGYTLNSEVISAPLLHFRPIFDMSLKKIVMEAPVPGGGAALVRLGHFLARVKIWGRTPPRGRNMVFRKMRLRVGQHERL